QGSTRAAAQSSIPPPGPWRLAGCSVVQALESGTLTVYRPAADPRREFLMGVRAERGDPGALAAEAQALHGSLCAALAETSLPDTADAAQLERILLQMRQDFWHA